MRALTHQEFARFEICTFIVACGSLGLVALGWHGVGCLFLAAMIVLWIFIAVATIYAREKEFQYGEE